MSALGFMCILVCVSWVYSEARMNRYRAHKTSDDFNLSGEEQSQLYKSRVKLSATQKKLTAAEGTTARLQQMSIGLRRTKDGDFDERNRLGKQLNQQLPNAISTVHRLTLRMEEAEVQRNELLERPRARALDWIKL